MNPFPDAIRQTFDRVHALIDSFQNEVMPHTLGSQLAAIGGNDVEAFALKTEEENRQLCVDILREKLSSDRWPKMSPDVGTLVQVRLMAAADILQAMLIAPLVSSVDSEVLFFALITKGWEFCGFPNWKSQIHNRVWAFEYGLKQGGERSFGT